MIDKLETRVYRLEQRQAEGLEIAQRIPLLATSFDIETAIFPPAVKARPTGNIVIASGGANFVLLTASNELYDTDNMHSVLADTSRLVATTAGIYHIHAQIGYTSNANNDRYADIFLNGATIISKIRIAAATTGITRVSVQTDYALAAGEYVEFRGWQDSGSSLNMLTGLNETYFEMHWVSAYPV